MDVLHGSGGSLIRCDTGPRFAGDDKGKVFLGIFLILGY